MSKLIYILGKRSRRIRCWYHNTNDKYMWGLYRWIIDTGDYNKKPKFKITPIPPLPKGSGAIFAGAEFMDFLEEIT